MNNQNETKVVTTHSDIKQLRQNNIYPNHKVNTRNNNKHTVVENVD